MKNFSKVSGFSLIEVALAVGIVAVGVTAVLGLLPGLIRQSANSSDTLTAASLADAIRVEINRRAAAGFDDFAVSVPMMTNDAEQGLRFVVQRNATDLRALDSAESPARDEYFLLVVRRFSSAPLAYDLSAASFALNVVVEWPYRPLTPAGLLTATLPADRQMASFNIAVNR